MKWPTWMDDAGLMAKSKEKGGETLAEHTWQVLSRLSDQLRLHSTFIHTLNDDRLWARMFWGCFLHDFGKAAEAFQELLRGNKGEWSEARHRHEVLSLGFVDWLFPKGHPDRDWIIAIIAFHHKDSRQIFFQYGGNKPMQQISSEDQRTVTTQFLEYLNQQIEIEIKEHLWRWVDECALSWASTLGFSADLAQNLITLPDAVQSSLNVSIFRALRSFSEWDKKLSSEEKKRALIYRGLIFTADHAASAGAGRFPDMPLTHDVAMRPLRQYPTLRWHQEECAKTVGSAIMISPTGSGKTEGAMLWAASQIEHRPAARLFYTLPYQASMNAMYQRLLEKFFCAKEEEIRKGTRSEVTIQHSRALLKFFQDQMALDEMSPSKAKTSAKWTRNLGRLHYFPIQIFSPYQMLKAAYSLKGYEALLVDYTDALFIFDEIHAYEPERMAMIITMIGWLRKRFGARFLVMTATLPPPVQNVLEVALGIETDGQRESQIVIADETEFKRSRRHTVYLLDGRLEDAILGRVQVDFEHGRHVLVCLNRVADAQNVYKMLKRELTLHSDVEVARSNGIDNLEDAGAQFDVLVNDVEIVLLHGRFNGADRGLKERILMARASTNRVRDNEQRFVTVATQAVEVSLDVDFDTIYTDPAPLDALLQRFGRVNRGRKTDIKCPVHVFREPNSATANDPYLPYSAAMVQSSLAVLASYCPAGGEIDEALVTQMLRKIYVGDVLTAWQEKYDSAAQEFSNVILKSMKPFSSATSELRECFYKMFDGREVLPLDCANQYYDALEETGYLGASKFVVNISQNNYGEFFNYGRITPASQMEKDEFIDHIDVPYSTEYGLAINEARQQEKAKRRGED